MGKPLGYAWLAERLQIKTVPHHVASYEGAVPAIHHFGPNWREGRIMRPGMVTEDTPSTTSSSRSSTKA